MSGMALLSTHVFVTTPVIETRSTSAEGADPTSHTVTLPSGIVAGDLVVIGFATDGAPTNTPPVGYTSFFSGTQGAAVKLELFWHKGTGAEGSTISITTDASQDSAHACYRISGAQDPDVLPPEASTNVSAVSTIPDPASLTPSVGSTLYMWLAFQGSDKDKTTDTFPSGYSNGQTVQGVDSANGCGIGSAEKAAQATSENPGTFTLSASTNWAAVTVAIIPA